MDINVLIKNNVDVNSGIELSRGMELYNDTMEYFLSNINQNVIKMKEAKGLSNLEEYALLVEKLKIDAMNLGFTKVADIANKHEINAKTHDMEYVSDNFDELMECINNMVEVVKEYLGSKSETIEVTSVAEIPTTEENNKILVVDDSNIVRNLIKRMVKDDYEMLNATDGQEAIEMLKEEQNELVGMLLDLNMPNVNGFEVLEFCANNNLFEKISVAIITGDDSKETVLKAFDYPIVDVLAKPFNENDVKRVITAMLTHK